MSQFTKSVSISPRVTIVPRIISPGRGVITPITIRPLPSSAAIDSKIIITPIKPTNAIRPSSKPIIDSTNYSCNC